MNEKFDDQLVWALRGLQRLAEMRGYPATARQIELARIEAEREFMASRSGWQAAERLRKLKSAEGGG